MSFPKHPGIYAIIHVESGKLYIGSASNIYSRWRTHKSELRRGLHHSPHLQNAWNKYGESAFQFTVIEACLKDAVILCSREQHWLDKYRGKLMNCAKNADPCYGVPQTPEQKSASRLRMLGNKRGQGHFYCGVLTERNVVEILHRYAAAEYTADIAASYGVTQYTIDRIVRRRIWKTVQVHPEVEAACLARSKSRIVSRLKLDFLKAEEIRRRHRDGESITSLAASHDVTYQCIKNVVRGKTWNAPTVVTIELPQPELPRPMPPKPAPQKKRRRYETKPRPKRVVVPCGSCGKEMLLPPCKTHRQRYCSRECLLFGMSVRQKLRMQDPANRAKISEDLRGHTQSEETKAKRAASLKRRREGRDKEQIPLFK